MQTTKVNSSTIIAIGFDEKQNLLQVQFKSGTYQYHDVKKEIYTAFLASDSKGKYLFKNIRGSYRFERI